MNHPSKIQIRRILFVYIVIEIMLCRCLILPLLENVMQGYTYQTARLLIYLLVTMAAVLSCLPYMIHEMNVFSIQQLKRVRHAIFAVFLIAAVQITLRLLFHGSQNTLILFHSVFAKADAFAYLTVSCICTPVMEELVFRSCVFSLNSPAVSTALSTILFALMHVIGMGSFSGVNLYFAVYALSGLILCLLYRHEKTLISPILAHSLFNLFVFIVMKVSVYG